MASNESATDGTGKKKQSGYTYWKRDTPDAGILPDNTPVKIDSAVAAVAQQQAADLERRGIGRWNTAGTWEEKDVSASARNQLQEILCPTGEGAAPFCLVGGVSVTSANVTGECQIYVVRGRPRLGYELKLNLKWKGEFDGSPVTGSMEIPALESDDADGFELKLKPDGNQNSKAAADAIRKDTGKQAIKEAVKRLTEHFLGPQA